MKKSQNRIPDRMYEILSLPRQIRVLPDTRTNGRKKAEKTDNPIVIRRAYDITTTCCRRDTDPADAPMSLHIRGEQSSSLLRCALIGAAAVGAVAAAGMLCKLHLRMQYRRRYAQRLKQQRMQQRCREAQAAAWERQQLKEKKKETDKGQAPGGRSTAGSGAAC